MSFFIRLAAGLSIRDLGSLSRSTESTHEATRGYVDFSANDGLRLEPRLRRIAKLAASVGSLHAEN